VVSLRRYKPLRLLGSGAYGKAYLMNDKVTNQTVVLKMMDFSSMSKHEQLEAAVEAQILAESRHENIVAFHGVLAQGGRFGIVMEFAEKGDLQQYVKARSGVPFPEHVIADTLVQTLCGLNYLHVKRIIHRDVKASNVLLKPDSRCPCGHRVLLADFGVSKVLERTNAFARTQIGTPYYIAPEIMRCLPYTAVADVWSLGVMIYFMITGEMPFQGANVHVIGEKIKRGEYKRLEGSRGLEYSQGLKDLVHQMLTQKPEDRPTCEKLLRSAYVRGCVFRFALGSRATTVPAPPGSVVPAFPEGPRGESELYLVYGRQMGLLPSKRGRLERTGSASSIQRPSQRGEAPAPSGLPRPATSPAQDREAPQQRAHTPTQRVQPTNCGVVLPDWVKADKRSPAPSNPELSLSAPGNYLECYLRQKKMDAHLASGRMLFGASPGADRPEPPEALASPDGPGRVVACTPISLPTRGPPSSAPVPRGTKGVSGNGVHTPGPQLPGSAVVRARAPAGQEERDSPQVPVSRPQGGSRSDPGQSKEEAEALAIAEGLFFPPGCPGRSRSCGGSAGPILDDDPRIDKLECYAAKFNPYESLVRARAREAMESAKEYEDRVSEMYLARLRRLKDEMLSMVDEDCLYFILNALKGREDPNGTYEGMQKAIALVLDELWEKRLIPAEASSDRFRKALQDFSVMFTHYLLIMR